MKILKILLPLCLIVMLSACSSTVKKSEIYEREVEPKADVQEMAKEPNHEDYEAITDDKNAIEKVVLEEQTKLEYDEKIAVDFNGKKMIIKGNNEFDSIEDFNKYYDDMKIKEKIDDFKFSSITVNEQDGVWYFDSSKILTQGELNRISKRDVLKENINNIVLEYTSLKGTISLTVFRDTEKIDDSIAKGYKGTIIKEDNNAIYHIFEDDSAVFKGVYYEQKRENGYKAYIDLAYYDQSKWTVSHVLKMRDSLNELFEKLNL